MNALFVGGPDLDVRGRDGRNFVLLADKEINTDRGFYKMPAGAVSDGASIPQALWSTGLAPFGPYWPAAFAHDCAYRGTLLEHRGDNVWLPAMLSKDDSDDLLSALMFSAGVSKETAEAIYQGVHLGGWKAFRDDRAELENAS